MVVAGPSSPTDVLRLGYSILNCSHQMGIAYAVAANAAGGKCLCLTPDARAHAEAAGIMQSAVGKHRAHSNLVAAIAARPTAAD